MPKIKTKKCKNCGDPYEKLPSHPPFRNWCSVDCAFQIQHKARLRAVKRREARFKRDERVKQKELKESIKPKSKWLKEAQASFNKYIRLRDYYDPCISCGKSKEEIEKAQGWKIGGCWDSGHFKTRGAKGQLRFILFNAHKQCKSCNAGSSKYSAKAATVGTQYRINLIEKIGAHKVKWLDNNNDLDCNKGNIDYLKRIKKIFNKKARVLKKRYQWSF